MAEAEEKQEAEQKEGEEEAGETKGSLLKDKKKLIILAGGGGALLLVLMLGMFFLFFSGGEEEEAVAEGEEAAELTDEMDPSEEGEGESNNRPVDGFGETMTLKTFNLNLGNPLQNHYVRLEVAIEYLGGEEQKVELESRMVQLRDAIVAVVSKKTREFLLGPDGKDQLKKEILVQLNRVLNKPIEAVYISDILIE